MHTSLILVVWGDLRFSRLDSTLISCSWFSYSWLFYTILDWGSIWASIWYILQLWLLKLSSHFIVSLVDLSLSILLNHEIVVDRLYSLSLRLTIANMWSSWPLWCPWNLRWVDPICISAIRILVISLHAKSRLITLWWLHIADKMKLICALMINLRTLHLNVTRSQFMNSWCRQWILIINWHL